MREVKYIGLGQVLLLAMIGIGLITSLGYSWILYKKQSQNETDLLIKTTEALMVPIINVATRGVNGGNIMKLKGKDATSFYLNSGVLYVEISGTTKGFPKSAFAPATAPKPINYTFIREGVDAVSMKNKAEKVVDASIDRQNWLYSIRFDLPDVENGGQVIAVFSAEKLKGSFWRTAKSVGLITVISLILIAVVAIFIGRQITRPIVQTSRHIKQISESLDFTDRVHISTGNEVGEMAESFNILLDKLHEIISEVDDSVIHISRAAEQLANSTTEASVRIQDQEAQTEQVVSVMDGMTSLVNTASEHANIASSSTQDANSEVSNGENIVNETVNVINGLASGVQTATSAIQRVGDDSNSINSVLDVIKGIAEQTNLLALNAAIEAARAGEQGRGFAVVADEVRSLASRTQESTQEIQQTIEQLQSGVSDAVKAIELGHEQAENSVAQAYKAGESLNVISHAVDKISHLNSEIASSFAEQAQSTEHVKQSISRIKELTIHAADDAQNNASSSQKLSQLSEQLKTLVGSFKL